MKDGYDEFFKYFDINPSELWEFAQSSIVYIDYDKAQLQWELLKNNIKTGNEPVYIRSFGRNGQSTDLFLNLYKEILPNSDLNIDPTNNHWPNNMMKKLTNYNRNSKQGKNSKYEKISNYQISHVYGKTVNPYSFVAPWNVIYLPKILDPFTGHEATGELVKNFTNKLHKYTFDIYKDMILEYNEINEELYKLSMMYVNEYINNDEYTQRQIGNFLRAINNQFSVIPKNDGYK